MPRRSDDTPAVPRPTADRAVAIKLLVFVAIAAILRLIAARNAGDSADSMHFVTHAIRFLGSGRLQTFDQSSGLWFAVTSIFYDLIGVTPFASRAASMLFGTASVIAMYVLARSFFDTTTSLFASLALAVAPFHIMQTAAEMDVMAMFFVLCSMGCLVRATKTGRARDHALAGVFLGLGVYTKVYPVLFLPSYVLYALIVRPEDQARGTWRSTAVGVAALVACASLFLIPTVVHNVLLHQDKGLLDFTFTRVLDQRTPQAAYYYESDPLFRKRNDWPGLFTGHSPNATDDPAPLLMIVIVAIWKASPWIVSAGLIGLITLLLGRRRERGYVRFLGLAIAFALPFLASILPLPKHFLFLEVLLVPAAAWVLAELNRRLTERLRRDTTFAMSAALVLATLVWLGQPVAGTFGHFYGRDYLSKVIAFRSARIPRDALVISDDRIYQGFVHWMFLDRAHMGGAEFWRLYRQQPNMPGGVRQVDVYYVECARGDCGWGARSLQDPARVLMEELSVAFQREGALVATIRGPDDGRSFYPLLDRAHETEAIRIYRKRMPLKAELAALGAKPKVWFLYPIGYPPGVRTFDEYEIHGPGAALLDRVAHGVQWLAIVLAFASPFYMSALVLPRSPATLTG